MQQGETKVVLLVQPQHPTLDIGPSYFSLQNSGKDKSFNNKNKGCRVIMPPQKQTFNPNLKALNFVTTKPQKDRLRTIEPLSHFYANGLR